ncbi:hypothetical protein BZZ01_04705 [Nostocales cyanobacterium HT-58-2]|nr:hypothetical protein BZZ01_04705 [Nostocales cyanobacterium HT-58-2]
MKCDFSSNLNTEVIPQIFKSRIMNLKNNKLKKNNWHEYLIPLLATLTLLILCIIISSKRFFWFDELISYYVLNDRSFSHMMVAFHDKLNNTPPLYFILGWVWAKVFGSTELSLRLFSSLGMCIAFVTAWITLRRAYAFWPASVGTLAVFCTSELFIHQNSEARMYGLFLALCSLGLFQFDVINRSFKCSKNKIWLNACIHAAIVQTHLFGIFYSGAILLSFISRDKYFNIFRPKIYLSIILSWLSLILYIPSFLNQADAGKPRTWIPIPSLADLINLVNNNTGSQSFSNAVPSLFNIIILFLIVISSLLFISRAKLQPNFQDIHAPISLLIFAYFFLAIPFGIWIISLTIKPIFVARYMMPSMLGLSIILAYFCSVIISLGQSSKKINLKFLNFGSLWITPQSILLSALMAILLLTPIFYAITISPEQFPGINDNKYGFKNLPIVAQPSNDFIQRSHYSPERQRYFFILDWQSALDRRSGLLPTQIYKVMDAFKRNYPEVFEQNVRQSKDFLKTYKRFLVLDSLEEKKCTLDRTIKDLDCPQWLNTRILNNPDYKVTYLGQIDDRKILGTIDSKKLLLVEKK